MKYRNLGRTGLKVSMLCLGTMQWGWTADENTAREVMDTFVEQGGNFIDTADIYSRWAEGNPGGVSEEIIGRWMKDKGHRSRIILATKLRQPMGDDPNDQGLSRKHILDAVDASLRRLQTDYIDLYQSHAFDAETSIDETLRAFDDLQRAGKVRYIGASNYTAWRLMQSLWSADVHNTVRYDSLQPHYNLVNRAEFERELKDVCEQYAIAVNPYSPLAGGFLTGKYKRGEAVESARSESIAKRYNNETSWRTVETVQSVAKEVGSTSSAVALAWLLAQPVITAPIIGANSVSQLQESLAATNITLTQEQVSRLSEASTRQEG